MGFRDKVSGQRVRGSPPLKLKLFGEFYTWFSRFQSTNLPNKTSGYCILYYMWKSLPSDHRQLSAICLFSVSENKYSLICSTFTGTLNQLHFILFIHLSSHFIFQFLHVVFWSTLACLLALQEQFLYMCMTLPWTEQMASNSC